MKDIRKYINKKNRKRAFVRGFNDFHRDGEYMTRRNLTWQYLGNKCAVDGMTMTEAFEFFEKQWSKGL